MIHWHGWRQTVMEVTENLMTVLINTRNRSTPRSSNRPPRPGLIFHKRTVSMSHRLRKVLLALQLACNCQFGGTRSVRRLWTFVVNYCRGLYVRCWLLSIVHCLSMDVQESWHPVELRRKERTGKSHPLVMRQMIFKRCQTKRTFFWRFLMK